MRTKWFKHTAIKLLRSISYPARNFVFLAAGFRGGCLVSKCSATLASVDAPFPGARQRFGGPNYLRHPWQVALLHLPPPSQEPRSVRRARGSGMGCDRAFWGGGGGELRHPCETLETAERAATGV